MRKGVGILALAGFLTLVALIAWQGAGTIASALLTAGWGLLLILPLHAVQMLFSALGWRALVTATPPISRTVFLWARWIREAVNSLLPVSQIGGELVGARLLAIRGLDAGSAGASVVVDLTMEVVSQFAFTVLGLALLLAQGNDEHGSATLAAMIGLIIAVPAVIGFIAAQRRGMLLMLERFWQRLATRWPNLPPGVLDGLHEAVQAMYRNPRAVIVSFNWHLLSWLLGAAEVWLILHLIGSPVTLAEALVLESLGQAVRSAAFLVPGALGVQEGGFLLLGALYGLGPEVGLALSLAKRVRELLLGLPGLLAWQLAEGRRLWRAEPVPEKPRKRS